MSVISSRLSSISSILKSPGVRSQIARPSNKVYFHLPKNVKSILSNFETGSEVKEYNDLICVLRNVNYKESDLLDFLMGLRECVSLLGEEHKILVDTLLRIKWISLADETISVYKLFLIDLISAQAYHVKNTIDTLVGLIIPDADEASWIDGKCTEADKKRLNNIHDILEKVLKVIPMSSEILLQTIRTRFPYMVQNSHIHEVFIYALLQIINYSPQLRNDILSLIINRLLVIDVNIPPSENDDDSSDEETMDDGSDCDMSFEDEGAMQVVSKDSEEKVEELHPMAHTLDVCMNQIIDYLHRVCFIDGTLQVESLKCIFLELLKIFETVILPVHHSQYVQYIMLYICSLKPSVAEAFVEWCWRKTNNPNVAIVIRQSSVAYISTLLATSRFVSLGLIKSTLEKLSNWIHSYITRQETSHYGNESQKEHSLFYSFCQAIFLIIIERHKDFIGTKHNVQFLHELDLPKIVTCKLNPLKFCIPEIAHSFADIAHNCQLAYCYTVLENNSRNYLPVIHADNLNTVCFDTFFPFDIYNLPRSSVRISSSLLHSTIDKRKFSVKYKSQST